MRASYSIGAFYFDLKCLICISLANRGKLVLSRILIGTMCTILHTYSKAIAYEQKPRIKIVGCNVASQVDHDDDIYGERGGH